MNALRITRSSCSGDVSSKLDLIFIFFLRVLAFLIPRVWENFYVKIGASV